MADRRACVRVPVPEPEGHVAEASLGPWGPPCEVARGGQRAGPAPVPQDCTRSAHGGVHCPSRLAAAAWHSPADTLVGVANKYLSSPCREPRVD